MVKFICTECDTTPNSDCKEKGHKIMKFVDDEDIPESYKVKLRELDPQWEGHKKVIVVKPISLKDIETYTKRAKFKCDKDDEEYWVKCDEDRYMRKPKCPHCGGEMIMTREKETELIRDIILQEPNEDVHGVVPFVILGRLFGQDVHKVEPGQDKKITAIMRSEKIRFKDTNRIVLEIQHIQDAKKKEIRPSKLELEKFKAFNRNKLIESFCPSIYGAYTEKEALLLSLIGGTRVDEIRGDINTLLIGDPSTGKTKLLTYAAQMLDKADYASGKSASGAGLVAGMDKLSDGTYFPRWGPIVYCSGGVVCIDEIDKMNSNDRSMLHEVMEKQTISLRKIGVATTLPARTVIIAAANPKASKYDSEATIRANINLPDSLISRFGLIFLMLNETDRNRSELILKHVSRCKEGSIDKVIEEDGLLTKDELFKYIAYAKTLKPKVKGSLADKLRTYYLDLEGIKQDAGNISLYVRGFEDLERLSEAQAKMRLSNTVEEIDVENAIKIHKTMLETLHFNTPSEAIQQILRSTSSKEELFQETVKNTLVDNKLMEDELIANLMKNSKFWPNKTKANKEVQNHRHQLLQTGRPGEYTYHE
ncbi:MAG: ATP-binding protein [Thermodesulfobacteriota bacterium]